MKIPFHSSTTTQALRKPAPTSLPSLPSAKLAALYRAARVGGDFYDFLQVGGSKLLFVMLDIAGKRETALHIAAAAQDLFREQGAAMFGDDKEDTQAITRLLLDMNRAIIAAAGGVVCAPAFLGCYDETINTLTYINAGHTPAVLKDEEGTLLLEANGLPLGLFSHSTHDSQYCALGDGAALVLVSKGLIETRGAHDEFGLERVQAILGNGGFESADQICKSILEALESYEKRPSRFGPSLNFAGFGDHKPNDITTLALMRSSSAQQAVAS
ncbi:MAG: serine phosphatase [Acidobacteriales bacterium]|nr:serine phosphatase [Terriglobales bacterium]